MTTQTKAEVADTIISNIEIKIIPKMNKNENIPKETVEITVSPQVLTKISFDLFKTDNTEASLFST